MANQYINNMSDLWNSAGTEYTSIKMNVTNAASASGSKLFQLLVGTVNRLSVDRDGALVAASTLTSAGLISSGTTRPSANDSAALGASGTAWSDLFLASGGVINWLAGDVTITHAADALTFAGALDGYKFDYCIEPTANDGAPLGKTTKAWSDLFLATGAVVNFGAGNAVLTHSDAVLTMTTGDLRVTTPHATNETTVATLGATQTLTNKTLTSPTLTSPTTASPTITGAPTAVGATWTNLGAVTTIDINGGTIDGTVIGATTPSTIVGTTITGSSATINGSLTATTSVVSPTGTFSGTLTGGEVRTGQGFASNATSVILSPAAGLNTIYLRPRGFADATGQITIDNAGTMVVPQVNSIYIQSPGALVLGASGSAIHLRPYGVTNSAHEAYQASDGGFRSSFFHCFTSPTATYSFYNGNGPTGAGIHGMFIHGNGSANAAAAIFSTYPGSGSALYAGWHQPNVAYWGIYVSGPAFCSAGVWSGSDIKLKSDIKDCDCRDAYNKVKAIRVKSYRKKEEISRSSVAYDEMGFVAQDVEPIIPEAVMDIPVAEPPEAPNSDGTIPERKNRKAAGIIKAVNDRTLLGTLWAAVQHQADLIERLEARIEGKKK